MNGVCRCHCSPILAVILAHCVTNSQQTSVVVLTLDSRHIRDIGLLDLCVSGGEPNVLDVNLNRISLSHPVRFNVGSLRTKICVGVRDRPQFAPTKLHEVGQT
jgi:hypothetical protein